MSARHAIPPAVTDAQIAASDPGASVWVSANAGSGKTYVLVQRVIRLLLDGVDPGKILCLTFTKAAAANMANRVFDTLASWIALDNAKLDEAIQRIEGRRPTEARRLRARRLFAEALETPGGLKVQTIHAFCTGLLQQFPFEADVPASFSVLEERAEKESIATLHTAVLLEAAGAPQTPLGRALATAIVAAADTTFADVMRETIAQRAALEGWIARAGSLEAALGELSRALGVAPGETLERVNAALLDETLLPVGEWTAIMAALADGSKTERDHIARLAAAQAAENLDRIESYLDVFCTDSRTARQRLLTNGFVSKHPGLAERMLAEQDRVCALVERRKALTALDHTAALVTIADAVLRRYRAEKERRGVLDYDDLIEKTLALFDNSAAAWVHYKLDLGVDHVLIDEAQDTSPQQWEVIRKLTAEFMAGEGARSHVRRSVFAVGDEKQSIYSFQGAAPHRFDEMRAYFERGHRDSGRVFERVTLTHSFRSSPDVLGAVDAVFATSENFNGLSADRVAPVHEAIRASAPGSVEIWPLFEPEERGEIEAWDAPLDAASEQSPQVRLARAIAATISCWLVRGDAVGDGEERRAVRPGDILVLVRQRSALFEAVIRALKDAGVKVAGADRLVLTQHIAVMDLMSLADALLLPEDDLALAEALKSPLFGLDDDHLFALAHGRRGSLRAALREKADEPPFADVSATLDRLALAAREQTPFAFYSHLLGAGGGRRNFLRRLGPEAADALDEFLALALDYESRHSPTLQGFVAWLRASEAEVKRDMDIARDEVRVMTVHGAKGLEAPIVVLADTVTAPAGPRDPRVLTLKASGLPPDAAEPMVWAKAKATDVPAVAEARDAARKAAENEHRRLLYVAMTRAADRIVVCGARGAKAIPKGCWYELVRDTLAADAIEEAADAGDGMVRRWRKFEPPAEPPPPAPGSAATAESEVPGWLARSAPSGPAGPLRIVPSDPGGPSERKGVPSAAYREAARRARVRGVHVHRLLQSLPAVPAGRRMDATRRYLNRAKVDKAEIEAIVGQVDGILSHPAFAPLFAEGSWAEVPVVGRLARAAGPPIEAPGRIDRLVVTDDEVLIADFKTDRAPPRRLEDVPAAHCNQLAIYRALLRRLYPGRRVRAALVYTETAALIECSDAMLDDALARLGLAAA